MRQSNLRALVLGLAIIAAVAATILLPVHDWMFTFVAWVRGAGVAGAVVLIGVYAVATVALVPGSLLTLGAGFVYGPFWGLLIVSPASVMGATAAFLLARGRLRPWVEAKVADDRRFNAIDRAVEEEGLKLVTLLRLSPIFPFVLLNYTLGLTRVRLRSYVLGSFVGMLPGTFLYVYLGSLVPDLAGLASGAPQGAEGPRQILLWLGVLATAAVTVYLTRLAHRALARHLDEVPEEAPAA